MNILLVINTPGGSKEENTIAVVPLEKLDGIHLDAIDGKMVNVDFDDADDRDPTPHWEEEITSLYKRLGLESQTGWENDMETKQKIAVPVLPTDLAEYVNPKMPVTIDRVVQIGWAV
jgi:hypothetical protein